MDTSVQYHPYYQTLNQAPTYITHTDKGSLYAQKDVEIGNNLHSMNIRSDVVSQASSTYTIVNGEVFFMDTSSNAITVTLPAVTSGRKITIKCTGNHVTYRVIVATPGGEQIDGSASNYTYANSKDSHTFISDGSNW
jgi:hypothetical protein